MNESRALDIALTMNILVKHPRSGLPPTVLYKSSHITLHYICPMMDDRAMYIHVGQYAKQVTHSYANSICKLYYIVLASILMLVYSLISTITVMILRLIKSPECEIEPIMVTTNYPVPFRSCKITKCFTTLCLACCKRLLISH